MIFVINAKKMVQLEQVEVEADDIDEAISKYLRDAKTGFVNISDPEWYTLSAGDLDVEPRL